MDNLTKEEVKGNGRNSSIELMKILGIILILISHIIPCYDETLTSYININNSFAFGYVWGLQFLRTLGQIGNCLFLIPMGYFLVNSKIKFKKIALLVLETLFYSWLILLVFLIFDRNVLTWKDIVKQIFPILFFNNWFITCYLLVYLISPLLNCILNNTKKETMALYLCFFFVLYSVICILSQSFYFYNALIGTAFIYLLSGYIRLHNPRFLDNKKICAAMLCFAVVCIIIFIAAVNLVGLKISAVDGRSTNLNYIVSFPVLLAGVSIFGLFKSINIKTNRVINKISSCSLGVYLITENYLIRNYATPLLFQYIYDNLGYNWTLLLLILGLVILYFIVAVIADILRKVTVEKLFSKIIDKLTPLFSKIAEHTKNLCNKLLG